MAVSESEARSLVGVLPNIEHKNNCVLPLRKYLQIILRMEWFLKFTILALLHLRFLTATETQGVLKGEPSQRAALYGLQHPGRQLNGGAPRRPFLLPLFPTASDPLPEMRESPRPILTAPEVQTPISAENFAARPRSERPQWDSNSPLPQFSPFTATSTANGKESGSSMQAATVRPTRYRPLIRTGAATGGDAGQPIPFVPSGRNTRQVEFQEPPSKRYQLDLNSEPPQFPASGQGITRLPGSALPRFLPWHFTQSNDIPESYQLGVASLAGPAFLAHLPSYFYRGNMPQFDHVETVGLPGLAHPPHLPFYSSGSKIPSPFQLGTQALPASAHPQESSVYSNDFKSQSSNPLQRERALKAAAPEVGTPPPKYGSASSVWNANAIDAGSLSSSIDEAEETLRNSEKTRSTLLYDRHAVDNNDATSNLRELTHQGNPDSLASFPSSAWAWVTQIWIRNKDAAISETNQHLTSSPKLTLECLSRHSSLHDASSSGSAALQSAEPIKFPDLLWAINMRALELLKGPKPVPTYLEEQKDFMKWLTDFMTNCKDQGHCSDPEGDFLHDKIVTALDSKDIDSGFHVMPSELYGPHYTVTNKQTLRNEAAVRAVMRYHKEKNAQLFEYLQDIGFVIKLAVFGGRWRDRNFRQPVKRFSYPHQTFQKAQLEQYVKPINLSPGEAAKQLKELFVLEGQGSKVWAWLSGLKSRIKLPFEGMTTSHNILQDYVEQITRESQKEATYGQAEWGNRLYGLLWHINGSFLETVGLDGNRKDFLQQQAAIRSFFDQILSKKKSKRFEAEALGENTKMDKFDELLNEWVFMEGKKPIFKVKNNHNQHAAYSSLSKEDIILAEIVVNIIGSYYKTQNIEKWISLFGDDANFVQFLIKIRLKQTNSQELERSQATLNSVVSPLELFPWTKRAKNWDGYLPKEAQRLFQHSPAIKLYRWIKDVQDKSTRS